MRNQHKIKDRTGEKYNMLTALRIVQHNPIKWECLCDCGNITVVDGRHLQSGGTKSCGCLSHHGNPKHNKSNTRVYRIYAKIKRRCFVKDDPAYPRYGGRGITMCDEWKNSFEAFYEWAYNNGYSDDLSIDRIDNDGNYSPENCRWADDVMQANNKRNNKRYEYMGETHTIPEWGRKMKIPYKTLYYRITVSKWPIEKALTEPVKRTLSKS